MREREISTIKDRIDLLLYAGAYVILTARGVDDMAVKYIVERGCMAIRRVDKKKIT